MIRASKLDINLYDEVAADKGATAQALAVVVLSGIVNGVVISWIATSRVWTLLFGTLVILFFWIVGAFITYIVGTKLLPEAGTKSDMGQVMRTIGFAFSPGVLRIFILIPFVGTVIMWIIEIWMFAAVVIAVRQALDYKSTWRAIAVSLIGFVGTLAIFYSLVTAYFILFIGPYLQ